MSSPCQESEIRRDVQLGLIKPDLEPLKCSCGSSDFYDCNHYYEAGYLSEFNRKCKKCDNTVGYWCIGSWSV